MVELLRNARSVQAGTALVEELAGIVDGGNRREEIKSVLEALLGQENPSVSQAGVAGLSEGLRNSGGRLGAQIDSLDARAARRYHALLEDALHTIKNKDAGPGQIQKSLRLLEDASPDTAAEPILGLLDRFPPAPIQIAAVRALSHLNGPGWEQAVLARWKTVAPEARREIFSAVLSKPERIDALLSAIESGRIQPGEVEAATRSAVLRRPEPAIRKRATALWGAETSGGRNEVIQRYRPALNLTGDLKSGQAVFERLCSACHRLNGVGTELGPNLALAATRSPDELLTHILDPNREVNPAYVQYNVETTDGETYSGLIVADQPASITLKGVSLEKTLPRTLIRKIGSAGQSLMPEGLEQGLSFQEMADLLSFLIESRYDIGTSGRSDSHDVPAR
jgi:putative heme-binding domain-containing protein